jgi:hypothetical protein
MKRENRSGLELEIKELEQGIEKISVLNYPGGLVTYTDVESRRLTQIYAPGIVYNGTYHGLIPEDDLTHEIIGRAFPPQHRELEEVVHPLISISTSLKEFSGYPLSEHPKLVTWVNHYIPPRLKFTSRSDPELVKKALSEEYLRVVRIGEMEVYFPTEKSVRAMCNTRGEEGIYVIALHTGWNVGIGHRYVPPQFSD